MVTLIGEFPKTNTFEVLCPAANGSGVHIYTVRDLDIHYKMAIYPALLPTEKYVRTYSFVIELGNRDVHG